MVILALASTLAAASETPDYTHEWREVLAARRAENIARLEAYAEAGRFPLNLERVGLEHTFMDASGSRCGVAELIWQSGHEALVVATYQDRNDVVVADLALGDPLMEWVLTSGLTAEEVAYIQRPAFYVGPEEAPDTLMALEGPTVDEGLFALETATRAAHFAMSAQQLKLGTRASLEMAIAALGDRVQAPPTTLPWRSEISHRTHLDRTDVATEARLGALRTRWRRGEQ